MTNGLLNMHCTSSFVVKKSNASITTAFFIIFLLGGALQIIGLASPTTCNIIALIFLLMFCALCKKSFTSDEAVLLSPCILILIAGTLNKSSISAIAVYVYYFLCLLISFVSAKALTRSAFFNGDRSWRLIICFLAFQLFVVSIQVTFADTLAAISKTPLIPLDVASGTFYLKSDATLSFFGIFALVASFSLKIRERYWILILSLAICFTTNSKVSQGAALITVLMLVPRDIFMSHRLFRRISILFIPTVLFFLIAIFYRDIISQIEYFTDHLYNAYWTRNDYEEANRLAALGDAIFGDSNFFGYGLLTYYNPLNKSWIYYSGFSLVYSLYFDTGVIGLLVFFTCFFVFTKRSVGSTYLSAIYFILFFMFSLVNFSISDIAILITYGVFINLSGRRHLAYA